MPSEAACVPPLRTSPPGLTPSPPPGALSTSRATSFGTMPPAANSRMRRQCLAGPVPVRLGVLDGHVGDRMVLAPSEPAARPLGPVPAGPGDIGPPLTMIVERNAVRGEAEGEGAGHQEAAIDAARSRPRGRGGPGAPRDNTRPSPGGTCRPRSRPSRVPSRTAPPFHCNRAIDESRRLPAAAPTRPAGLPRPAAIARSAALSRRTCPPPPTPCRVSPC
jgi:hypothetical protein